MEIVRFELESLLEAAEVARQQSVSPFQCYLKYDHVLNFCGKELADRLWTNVSKDDWVFFEFEPVEELGLGEE